MKIKCLHGFFIFEEQRAGEVSDFISLFGLELERRGDFYTFADLVDAPEYSIKGKALLNQIAIETYEGQPWEVFEQNQMVYNYDTGLLVPITTITALAKFEAAGNMYLSSGLLLPGSLTDAGLRVKNYAAWFSSDRMKFRYTEVDVE